MVTSFSRIKKILILEDDERLNNNYQRILGHRYIIKYFLAINELHEYLLNEKIDDIGDLLLCDIHLPDGYLNEFLVEQKELIQKIQIPIMIVSSVDDVEMFSKLYNYGVCDYLLKNFTANELQAKISRALDNSTDSKQNRTQFFLYEVEKGIFNRFPDLTKVEQSIISILLFSKNFEVLRSEVILKIWGDTSVTSNTLSVHLSKIRKKIPEDIISFDTNSAGTIKLIIEDIDSFAK